MQSIPTNRKKKLYVLIMAGGSGTRLWPLSTQKMPKQLLKINSSKTLIEETIQRAMALTPIENIVIGTNFSLKQKIEQKIQNSVFSLKEENFLIEPTGKNTAPIITLFCSMLQKKAISADAAVLVLSADHYIHPIEEFTKTVQAQAGAGSFFFKRYHFLLWDCSHEGGNRIWIHTNKSKPP